RSAESLLNRRVILPPAYNYGGNSGIIVSAIITEVVRDQCERTDRGIEQSEKRKIQEIKSFSQQQPMKKHTEPFLYNAKLGDNLYEQTVAYCKQFGIGFRIFFKEDINGLELAFYDGKNRTRSQTEHTYVIFSQSYDNILSSEYFVDYSTLSNMSLIAGAGEGANRVVKWVPYIDGDTPTGIDRYETYIDARDLQKEKNGMVLSDNEYYQSLITRAKSKMVDTQIVDGFNAEIETSLQFEYKKDWDLGDIVEIETEYGINAQARIIEVIECDDETGYKVAPTLSTWEGM
ncbi:MAG: siphovirus ReqiPepy6 Gp37-like family protein, partial [Ruminococcus sp.]|nr:siphovirus ReqiPepy6 Gp37-like family protein [Ruminococcus sp.]